MLQIYIISFTYSLYYSSMQWYMQLIKFCYSKLLTLESDLVHLDECCYIYGSIPSNDGICVPEGGQFSLNCRVYNYRKQIIINRTESNHFFLPALVPLNQHMYQLCTNPVQYQVMRKSSICPIRSYASTIFGSTYRQPIIYSVASTDCLFLYYHISQAS